MNPNNCMDWYKVERFIEIIETTDFPEIIGFYDELTQKHIEEGYDIISSIQDVSFGEPLRDNYDFDMEQYLGEKMFFITDGHHRAVAGSISGCAMQPVHLNKC